MIDNVASFWFRAAVVLFFITAAAIFFFLFDSSVTALNIVKSNVNDEKAVYQSKFASEEYNVTGAEIICDIYKGLSVDIDIDGTLISKDVDINTFDYSIINPDKNFNETLVLDASGLISEIKYKIKY